MTMAATVRRNSYTGNGATSSYPFTFRVDDPSYLRVITVSNATPPVQTELAYGVGFTAVRAADISTGGTVTLTAGNLTNGYQIVILGKRPLTQTTSFKNQGSFKPEAHDAALDALCQADQEQQEQLNRSVKLSRTVDPVNFNIHLPPSMSGVAGAKRVLTINASGNGFAEATDSPMATDIAAANGFATAAAASATAAAASQTATAASAAAAAQSAADAAASAGSVGNPVQSLTGEVTTGTVVAGAAPATVSNAAVIAKVLTGFVAAPGTVAATDSILAAIQKLVGNLTLVAPRRNHLLNSNFDFWQRNTTGTIANGISTFVADRWYAKNSLGTNGVLTFSRNSTAPTGSKYAGQLQITTAPTAGQANGCELYQTLENRDSLLMFNQTCSFSIQAKALGNVTQVGVQFFYKTTENLVDTAIGTEQTATVNTSSFVTASISGQALGTAMTTAGTIGVRIRVTGVSSGNLYALNNGFIVGQAILNVGAVPASYSRAGTSTGHELALCQRYYEKSYDTDVPVGSGVNEGARRVMAISSGAGVPDSVNYAVEKRITGPAVQVYSTQDGAGGNFRNTATSANQAATAGVGSSSGTRGFGSATNAAASATGAIYTYQWTSDAELS